MNKFAKQLLPFCSLIFIISLWAALEPENFLSLQNFSNVLRRSSVNGIMAAGMTFIIITAGIDLSVGSMLAMCGMLGSLGMLFAGGGTWTAISGGSFIDMGWLSMLFGTVFGIGCGGDRPVEHGAGPGSRHLKRRREIFPRSQRRDYLALLRFHSRQAAYLAVETHQLICKCR